MTGTANLPTDIARAKHLMVTTYRRDGTPMPTPVWFVTEGDHLYFTTRMKHGKPKRLRNNPAVTVAPCTFRGKLLGAAVPGTAEKLDPEQERRVWRLLARRYGLIGRLTARQAENVPTAAYRITLS